MSLDGLVTKYIASTEDALSTLQTVKSSIIVNSEAVGKIIGHVKDYLEDAKYYRNHEKLEVSLTSVAYCEGLLDALKLLGAVKFEWPAKPIGKSER